MGYIFFCQRISSKSQSDPFPDAFAFSSNITLKKARRRKSGFFLRALFISDGHSVPIPVFRDLFSFLTGYFPVRDRFAFVGHTPVNASLQVIDVFRILAKAFAGRVGNLSNIVTVACGCFHDDI